MSSKLRVRVGPFLKCLRQRVEKEEKRWGCVKEGCSKHHKAVTVGKFCDWCGKPYGEYLVKVKENSVDPYEETGGGMTAISRETETKYDYVVANCNRNAPRSFEFDSDCFNNEGALPLDIDQITGEIAWFEKFFGPEIALLRKAYGDGNVESAWGILAWYN